MTTDRQRIEDALDVVRTGIDEGAHHQAWIIDQMVRALTGSPSEEYSEFIRAYEAQGLEWDHGIAP